MELYILTFYEIPGKIASKSFRRLSVPDSFNLYFILFYIVNF